jgi:hypothetical protein
MRYLACFSSVVYARSLTRSRLESFVRRFGWHMLLVNLLCTIVFHPFRASRFSVLLREPERLLLDNSVVSLCNQTSSKPSLHIFSAAPPGDPTLARSICISGQNGAPAKCDYVCVQDAIRADPAVGGCVLWRVADSPTPVVIRETDPKAKQGMSLGVCSLFP